MRGGEGSPLATDSEKIQRMVLRCEVGNNNDRRIVFTDPKNANHCVVMTSGPDHVWMRYKEGDSVFYVDPNMGGSGLTKKEAKETISQLKLFDKRWPILNSDAAEKEAGSPFIELMKAGGMCDQIACAIAKALLVHPDKKNFLNKCTLRQLILFSYDSSATGAVLCHKLHKAIAESLLVGPVPAAYL